MKVSAYYSLALRPMALSGAFLFLLALLMPGLMPYNLADPFLIFWGRDVVPAAVTDLLWRETLIIPAAVGVIAGAMAASLRSVGLSGTLPGVRRAVSLGTLQIMLVVLLITAYLHRGFAGHPIAAVGVAGVLYSAWVVQANGIQWNIVRLIAVAAVLIWWKPGVLDAAAEAAPIPMALLAPVSVVWLMRAMRSADSHRRQAVSALTPEVPAGWLRGMLERKEPFRPSLRGSDNWVTWFRISNSAGPGNDMWVKAPVYVAAWWSVLGYVLASPMSFLIYPMALWSGSSRGLPGAFLYPVSRARRATVAYMSAMGFTLIFIAVSTGITVLLYALKPFAGMMDEVPVLPPPLPVVIGLMAVWMPVAMWVVLRPPVPEPTERVRQATRGPYTVTFFVGISVYALCMILSVIVFGWLAGGLGLVHQVLLFGAVAALSHAIFLWLLYRTYARRDLV